MDKKEADRRNFEVELIKARLFYAFTKDALLLSFFMFFIGGLAIMSKSFKVSVLMVFLVGIFIVIIGLVAYPRVIVHEFDRLKPKD